MPTRFARLAYSAFTAAAFVVMLIPMVARATCPPGEVDIGGGSCGPPLVGTGGKSVGNPFLSGWVDVENVQDVAGVGSRDLESIAGLIIQSAFSIIGVLFLVYMVWAGYLWMTAHGDGDQVAKAKDMIKNAVVGMAVTFGAYAITQFVITRLFDTGVLVR